MNTNKMFILFNVTVLHKILYFLILLNMYLESILNAVTLK